MGKKKAGGAKGGNKSKGAKSPFAVASAKNKKKPKEVKSNLKKVCYLVNRFFFALNTLNYIFIICNFPPNCGTQRTD